VHGGQESLVLATSKTRADLVVTQMNWVGASFTMSAIRLVTNYDNITYLGI